MRTFSFTEFIETMGESDARKALSSFRVSRNPDVESFIRNNAFAYQRSHNARTYLIVDDAFVLSGYFTLSLSCMRIPEGISNSLRKKMQGYGRYSADTVPCYLIGQVARESAIPSHILHLADILGSALGYIKQAQILTGGRFISVDCTDELISLYERHGFREIGKSGALNQMIMFIA